MKGAGMARETVLNLDHRLDTAGDLARGLIMASVMTPPGQMVSFMLPSDRARSVGREIEGLVGLRAAAGEMDALQEAAGAEMKRLHDAAQETLRKALVTLGFAVLFFAMAATLMVLA